jgi:hypothetical protein
MASRKAGVIQISLNAGTAAFLADMDKANAKIIQFGQKAREAGSHTVSSMQASSAAIRLLENPMGSNIRAVERFLATTLKLGPVLQNAFPIAGGLAFGFMLAEQAEHVTKFFKDIRDANEKAAGAWRALGSAGRLSNDELRVSIDRVNLEIAKLEGKRENTLKLMLDEARVAADHLGQSLNKAFAEFSKFADENSVGAFRQFLGEGSTYDVRMMAGGNTGTAGIQTKLERAGLEGAVKIGQAKTPAEIAAAETARDVELHRILNGELADANRLLEQYAKLAAPTLHPVNIGPGMTRMESFPGKDETQAIAQMKHYVEVLQSQNEAISLNAKLREATARKDIDTARTDNAKLDRPLEKMTAELVSRVAEAKAKLDAAGGDEAGKVIARGMAEAAKAITTVNDRLRIQKQALLDVSPNKSSTGRSFLQLTTEEASYESEAAFKDKVQEVNSKLADQLTNQRMINGAIGEGWDAMAKVNAELLVMHDFTPTQYNDPSHAAEIQAARERALAVEIAKHTEETNRANLATRDQITLETKLAQVESLGAEAVRLATLQHSIAIMQRNGATKESIQLAIDLNNAERAREVSKQIADIDQQIAALKRLTAAYGQGEEAVRKAELENKLDALKRQGPASLTGSQAIMLANTEAENKAAEAAGKRVTQYADQLHQLQLENDELDKMLKNGANIADIERTRREILDAELKIMVQQQLAQRDLSSGMRAFFLEMQQQAKSAAAIEYEALNSALDKTSENLTRALTGQKTEWAKMFQGIGRDMLKQSIKSGLQTGLGALGDLIPGVKGAKDAARKASDLSKIGHTAANPWFVRVVGTGNGPGNGDFGGEVTPTGPGNILFGNGGLLGTGQVPKATGGFLNILKGLAGIGGPAAGSGSTPDVSSTISYPEMAGGGNAQPNQVYSWNENGKELFMSGAGGHIANAAQTRQMLGGSRGGDTYIDARGTDPGTVEQRVRIAMRDTYAESVSGSVRAYHQQSARTPQRG